MMRGKVVLITGASTGMGRSTAEVLAREGALVYIADVQDGEGEKTVSMVRSAGSEAEYHHVDVGDYEQVKGFVSHIVAKHGRLDGAFNNAGIEGRAAKLGNQSLDDWDRVIKIDLSGVFNCMKCELEQMSNQDDGGSIVNTSSVAGLRGARGASGYAAAKHGVVGLTKSAAIEYGPRNIRVNAICPGIIETPMFQRVNERDSRVTARLIESSPMRRAGKPAEIGEVAAWLLSDRSSFVTGVSIPVDGGVMAQ